MGNNNDNDNTGTKGNTGNKGTGGNGNNKGTGTTGGNSGKQDRGFASMDSEKQSEIASRGGKASHGGGRNTTSSND